MDAQAPLPGLDAFPPIVEQPIVEAKAADPVVSQEERNRQAATMLDFAKRLLQKSPSAAQKRLKEIVEKYPETPAAEEAKRLMN